MTESKKGYSYTKEYKQEHYRNNKEKYKQSEINNNHYDPIFCKICNTTLIQKSMTTHLKSQKHARMQEIEIIDDKIKCKICNKFISKSNYKRHTRSKTHIENINLNIN